MPATSSTGWWRWRRSFSHSPVHVYAIGQRRVAGREQPVTRVLPNLISLNPKRGNRGALVTPPSTLANNVARLLVLTQPDENGRSQFPVAGPLGEFDFTDKLRIDPVHLLHHGRGDSLHPLPVLF